MADLKNSEINDTGYLLFPTGSTAERPVSSSAQMRYNTSLKRMEYYDSTVTDWTDLSTAGVIATGSNHTLDITQNGERYRVHYFTTVGTGSFDVTRGGTVEYLIVAGGGQGGGNCNTCGGAGGGGAGGVLQGTTTVTSQSYEVIVGDGGSSGIGNTNSTSANGENGENSSVFSLTSIGGGGGKPQNAESGSNGGSGGGGSGGGGPVAGLGGSGTTGQGYDGGAGLQGTPNTGGAGGGGGSKGGNGTSGQSGDGGNGIFSMISNPITYYAGGGSGGLYDTSNFGSLGTGGDGGGGFGGINGRYSGNGEDGAPSTGGGGGGAFGSPVGGEGGDGGSGIVIIRYKLYGEQLETTDKLTTNNLIMEIDPGNPNSYKGSGTSVSDSRLYPINGIAAGGGLTIGHPRSNFTNFRFDGSNGSISIHHSHSPFRQPKEITYDFIVRKEATGQQHIMGTTSTSGQGSGGVYFITDSEIRFTWTPTDPTSDRYISGTISNSLNTYSHFTFTMDFINGTYQWYQNGATVTTTISASTTDHTPKESYNNKGNSEFDYIGARVVNSAVYFNGRISMVRIYDRELTASEVLQNYNVTKWRYGI